MIPHIVSDKDHYHHPKYDPFWAACEDAGVILNIHSGAAPMSDFFGKSFPEDDGTEYPGAVGMYVSEVMWWTYRPLNFMIWGGVFERFPKLKLAIAEAGTAWMIPSMMRMLDHNYTDVQFSAKLGDFRDHLSMKPSDYFKRNVAIGASCMPRADAEARHDIGLRQIMWGSDYPHPEGTWPNTKDQMYDTFRGLPEDEIGLMLGENAIDFYGFDRAKLTEIAQRIGPEKQFFQS
jgi:predicted TIM-barrel fold metal-dependent hydrolase